MPTRADAAAAENSRRPASTFRVSEDEVQEGKGEKPYAEPKARLTATSRSCIIYTCAGDCDEVYGRGRERENRVICYLVP